MNSIKIIPMVGCFCILSCTGSQEPAMTQDSSKIVIYQVLPRIFGNDSINNVFNGTITENGVGKFEDFTSRALDSIHALGFNHIWYTGIISHATQTDYSQFGLPANSPGIVKGKAGSPYAIRDYYDVNADLAVDVSKRMEEFDALVNRTHESDMKVIIDFIPNHVAREYNSQMAPEGVVGLGSLDDTTKGFSIKNNFYYLPGEKFQPGFDIGSYTETPAKATGNDVFSASPSIDDWYETIKLNYGVDYQNGKMKHFDTIPATWTQMKDILLFWANKNIDGYRVDLAEMVPVEFWEWAIPQVKKEYPDLIFIAEIYNPDSYRDYIKKGKFDYLYDKVGLYDTLKYVIQGKSPASSITLNAEKLADIEANMLNFLENHDEQRIASPDFAGSSQAGIPMMIVSSTYGTNPMLVYFGQELGESAPDAEGFNGADGRTTIFDYWSLPSIQAWRNNDTYNTEKLTTEQKDLQAFYKKLLNLSNEEAAISNGIRYDLTNENIGNSGYDERKVFSYLRGYQDEVILTVVNFDTIPQTADIIISPKALAAMGLPNDVTLQGVDLLTGKAEEASLSSSNFKTNIAPHAGKLIKFKNTKHK